MAIRSFADKETEKVFHRVRSARLPQDIQQVAYRKLRMLHNSMNLQDLRVPPANRLEKLRGERNGNTVFGSMTNGGFAFIGKIAMRLQ